MLIFLRIFSWRIFDLMTFLNWHQRLLYGQLRTKNGEIRGKVPFGGLIGLILIFKEHFHNFLDKIKIAKVTSPTF